MMDQTHVTYFPDYWQEPQVNSWVSIWCFEAVSSSLSNQSPFRMPYVTKVQSKKMPRNGAMRIIPEGTQGAW